MSDKAALALARSVTALAAAHPFRGGGRGGLVQHMQAMRRL